MNYAHTDQKKKKRGFTLAEFLVVIAITMILAGVSFVAAIHYRSRLRRLEMDHTAKEIFLAAQNQLSLENSSGTMERLLSQAGGTDADKKLGIPVSVEGESDTYAILYPATDDADCEEIRDRLLPFGTIDETVRADGSYLIIYGAKSGTVREVWYSDRYKFVTEDIGSTKLSEAAADDKKREHYTGMNDAFQDNGQPIGHYAGDSITDAVIPNGETLNVPKLEVLNKDVLCAKVKLDGQFFSNGAADKYEVKLFMEGLSSNVKAYLSLYPGISDGRIRVIGGTSSEYWITLDNLTLPNQHFADLSNSNLLTFKTNEKTFIPGEDVRFYVQTSVKGDPSSVKTSEICQENSIFGGKRDGKKVLINSIRHLQNLESTVSSVDMENQKLWADSGSETCYTAVQQKNLSWADYCTGLQAVVSAAGGMMNPSIYNKDNVSCTAADHVYPLEPTVPFHYDGNTFILDDLSVKTEGTQAAGLFGNVKEDLTVSRLKLSGMNAESGSDAGAGALIGLVKDSKLNVHVDDVLIQYPNVLSNGVKKNATSIAQINAGAVIGDFTGNELVISRTMAVNSFRTKMLNLSDTETKEDLTSDKKMGYRIRSVSGIAGGLIGAVTRKGSITLSDCASSVYVDGNDYAGGLIGMAGVMGGTAPNVTIENCFVGGHTSEKQFVTNVLPADASDPFNTTVGRYNIIARSIFSGGLAAVLPENAVIHHSFVTASVYSPSYNKAKEMEAFVALYGEFVNSEGLPTEIGGKAASDFPYCYSVASVAAGTAQAEKVKNYSADIQTYFQDGAKIENRAFPYDTALNGEKYPYPTVYQLLKEHSKQDTDAKEQLKDLPKFARVYFGDWPEQKTESNLKLWNKNRLWVDYVIDMPTEKKYISISITGTMSLHTAYCLVKLLPENIGESQYIVSADLNTLSKMRDGTQDWGWTKLSASNNRRLEITTEDTGKLRIRLFIDNKAFDRENYEYLCPNPDPDNWNYEYLTAGENIIVRASENSLIPGGTDPKDEGNSFFETLTPDGDGYKVTVSNCRNLINLNFCENLNITSVEQTDNILWDTDDTVISNTEPYCKELSEAYGPEGVVIHHGIRAGNGFTQAGSFKPIESQTLRSYDGGKKVIAKLTIDNLNWGNKNSALFEGTSHLQIRDLYLKDPVMRSKNNAAAVVATAGTYYGQWNKNLAENLELTNVHVYGDETNIRAGNNSGGLVASAYADKITMNNVSFYGKNAFVGTISGDGTVGGLIGFLKTSGVMELKNSMFSGYIDGNQKPDSVGGLVGKIDLSRTIGENGPNMDDVKIQNCYVGGRNASYPGEADAALKNQSRTSIVGKKFVGGLIGFGKGPLQILNSFSMAGLYSYDTGIGGLIGCYQDADNLLLQECYFGGLLAMQNSGPNYKAGIMIGQTVVSTNPYDETQWTLQTDFSGSFKNCAYISRNSFGISMKLVGSADNAAIGGVTACSGTNYSAIETSETIKAERYDTSLPETYPYKVWTTENGTKIYRGDWIQ